MTHQPSNARATISEVKAIPKIPGSINNYIFLTTKTPKIRERECEFT
jgi:hypothetical protein